MKEFYFKINREVRVRVRVLKGEELYYDNPFLFRQVLVDLFKSRLMSPRPVSYNVPLAP